MQRRLFNKANYLKARTKIITETDHGLRFEVVSENNTHEVNIKYQKYSMVISCSCTHQANKPTTFGEEISSFCAHELAAISYIVDNPELVPDIAVDIIQKEPEDIFK